MAAPSGSGSRSDAAAGKHLRVLLPFSRDSLRIPGELAVEVGGGEALVVVPFGKGKVMRVEVGGDAGGAFLGRGWPEFAASCGVGAGWTVVLRHHGGGVLTVKAFDASCCLRELGTPPAVQIAMSSKDTSRRSQFISVLSESEDSMVKMQIPAKFVQQCITKEDLNNRMAVVSGPHGKMCQIELEINQLGVFFAGGWSQFMAFHGITAANSLLLRYEGNMVFTVKVFELNGCQRECKQKQIAIQQNLGKQQEAPSASIQNCMSKNNWPSGERQMIPKGSFQRNSSYETGPPSWIKKVTNTNSLERHHETAVIKKDWSHGDGNIRSKGSMTFLKQPKTKSVFEIGRPSWIRKEMNAFTIENRLYLPFAFCEMTGLKNRSMIRLKTSMSSPRFWRAHLSLYHAYGQLGGSGWKSFCHENKIKAVHRFTGDFFCCYKALDVTILVGDRSWEVLAIGDRLAPLGYVFDRVYLVYYQNDSSSNSCTGSRPSLCPKHS